MNVKKSIEFEDLPPEIQETIHRFLPAKDLFSVAKTSRSLNSLTQTQSLWTKLTLDLCDIYDHEFYIAKDLKKKDIVT